MTYDEAGNYVENIPNLQKNIRAYVNALSEKYNTVGRSRTITSAATGQPVQVDGGSYGFLIDTEKECRQASRRYPVPCKYCKRANICQSWRCLCRK